MVLICGNHIVRLSTCIHVNTKILKKSYTNPYEAHWNIIRSIGLLRRETTRLQQLENTLMINDTVDGHHLFSTKDSMGSTNKYKQNTFQLFHTYEETRFSRSSRLSLRQTHTVPNGAFLFIKLNIEVNLIVIPEQLIFDSITVSFGWLLATMSCLSCMPHTTMRYKLQCGGSYCCCSPSRGSYRGGRGGGHRCGGCLTCTLDAPCWKSTKLLSPVARRIPRVVLSLWRARLRKYVNTSDHT